MTKKTWQIAFAGEGGQGIILSGILLGECAATREGKNATQTQEYGTFARGGFCKAEVVISEEPISYPYATEPDVLVVFTEEALTRFKNKLRPDTLVVYDKTFFQLDETDVIGIEMTRLANDMGNIAAANLIGLGFVLERTKVIKQNTFIDTLESRFSGKVLDLNKEAFQKGVELAAQM